MPRPRETASALRYFNASPEVIRFSFDVRPLSPVARNVEDLLFERGIHICHETVRLSIACLPRTGFV